MTAVPRQLLADLLPNLRDCGGMRTADGRALRNRLLLRSAALVELGPRVTAALTAEVGTGTYVDLRTDAEVCRDGAPGELIEAGWAWRRLPVSDGNTGEHPAAETVRRCLRALPTYLAAAAQVSELLGSQPVTVGCAVGKDRTGLVIAIILHWLDIERAEILDDFTASNACLRSGRALLPTRWRGEDHAIGVADAAVCAAVLDRTDRTPAQVSRTRASGLFTKSHQAAHEPGASSGALVAAAARRA